MLRYSLSGRHREMGLGGADPNGKVGSTLAEAREKAMQQRRLLRKGVDPLDHRQGQEAAAAQQAVDTRRTFRDCAVAFLT